ncbi:MAG: hypothetical protein ABIG11_00880 [bacterium]
MKLLGLKAEVSERNPPKLHYTRLAYSPSSVAALLRRTGAEAAAKAGRSSSYGRVLARIHPQSEACGFPCPTAGTRLPSVGQGRVRRRIKYRKDVFARLKSEAEKNARQPQAILRENVTEMAMEPCAGLTGSFRKGKIFKT